MSVQIIPMNLNHIAACMDLWKVEGMARDSNLQQQLPEFLKLNSGLSQVALSKDKVIGVVLASFNGLSGWIFRLVVSPQERGNGVGRKLMEAAEAALVKRGGTKLTISCEPELIPFYKAQGYQATAGNFMFKQVEGV